MNVEIKNELQAKTSIFRSERIFLWIFIVLVVGSIGATYWRMMIAQNYVIIAQADCDPSEEKCFVHVCDPSPDVDGECAGNLEEDIWYTKNIRRIARNVPTCDPSDENCNALVCGENEPECFFELCDEANVPEGDFCNDPAQYVQNNLSEDDANAVQSCDSATSEICPLGNVENVISPSE